MTGPAVLLAAVAAGTAVLVLFVAHRPLPGRCRVPVGAPTPALVEPRCSPLARIGGAIRRAVHRPPDQRAERRLGRHLLVGAVLLAILPPLALVYGVGAGTASVLGRRRQRLRADSALVEELPEVVDLLRLAVDAGLTVPLAVGVVAARGQGALAAELGRARRSAELGVGLADALDEVPHRLGEPVRPVIRVLSGSLRDGSEVGVALERVAAEVRTSRRRAAEERARRVSVRLLFPLVCCVLPAFALLTIVPLLAGALRSLAF